MACESIGLYLRTLKALSVLNKPDFIFPVHYVCVEAYKSDVERM